MAKDPDDRPPTARALLIARCCGALGRPVAGPPGRGRLGDRASDAETGQQATAVGGEPSTAATRSSRPISSGAMGAVYRAIDRETRRRGRGQAPARRPPRRALRDRGAPARQPEPPARGQGARPLQRRRRASTSSWSSSTASTSARMLKRSGDPGLPLGDAIEYARHGCEALQYVHGQQIVHRDVKPQNMILGDDGVVLVDFGVARALGSDEDQGTIAVGTPRYMAPEVFAGGTVSAASDIFSLAATLWTLLVGTPPRYGDVLKLDKLAPGAAAGARPRRSPAAWRCCPSSGSLGGRRSPRRSASRSPRDRGAVAGPVASAARRHAPARHRGDRPHRRRHVRGRGVLDRADRPGERRARLRGGLGRRRAPRSSACGCRRASGSPARSWRAARACPCPSAARTRASPARSPPGPATCPTRWSSPR